MAKVKRPSRPAKPIFIKSVRLDKVADPTRLEFVREPNSATMSEGFRALVGKIQEVEHVVRTVFADYKALRRKFFRDLHVTADTGLRGSDYSIEQGLANLEGVKVEIAESFPSVRDAYWNQYGIYFLFSLGLLALGGLVYFFYFFGEQAWAFIPKRNAKWDPFMTILLAVLWIPVGVAFGMLLEFAYSIKKEIEFGDLIKINSARWHPLQRLVNNVFGGYALAGAMALGIFQIGVGSLLLNEFATTKPYLALLIGFVAGFASPYVQDLVSQIRPTVRAATRASS